MKPSHEARVGRSKEQRNASPGQDDLLSILSDCESSEASFNHTMRWSASSVPTGHQDWMFANGSPALRTHDAVRAEFGQQAALNRMAQQRYVENYQPVSNEAWHSAHNMIAQVPEVELRRDQDLSHHQNTPPWCESQPRLGIYTAEQREIRLRAYREKRKQRRFGQVRYVKRKQASETRARVRGRFVKGPDTKTQQDSDSVSSRPKPVDSDNWSPPPRTAPKLELWHDTAVKENDTCQGRYVVW